MHQSSGEFIQRLKIVRTFASSRFLFDNFRKHHFKFSYKCGMDNTKKLQVTSLNKGDKQSESINKFFYRRLISRNTTHPRS